MTVREHLKKLPLQKRLQAMENIRKANILNKGLKYSLNFEIDGFQLIGGFFDWKKTKQGICYWSKVQDNYMQE